MFVYFSFSNNKIDAKCQNVRKPKALLQDFKKILRKLIARYNVFADKINRQSLSRVIAIILIIKITIVFLIELKT